MRGSDPDAALLLARNEFHAGEDPRFIARRIMICAQDVGLADPDGAVLANAAFQTAEFVAGRRRGSMAEITIYIATANKSNRRHRRD